MNFLLRALTSFVYVGLLLGSLYLNAIFFIVVLCSMAIIAQSELHKMTKTKFVFGYLFFPLITTAANFIPELYPFILGAGILGTLVLFIFYVKQQQSKYNKTVLYFLSIFQICIPMVLLALLGATNALFVLCFFGAIWLNDTGAYIIGSLFGKRKLAPSISPNKTIEGTLGGVFIATLLMVYFIRLNIDTPHYIFWIAIFIITAVLGALGDLAQSKIKRLYGVKDSGSILPGHGGIYDRIDSTIFAAPVFIILLNLFGYVS